MTLTVQYSPRVELGMCWNLRGLSLALSQRERETVRCSSKATPKDKKKPSRLGLVKDMCVSACVF